MFVTKTLSLVALLASTALPSVSASPFEKRVPKVKAVRIKGGCSAWPDYDSSSKTAGPFIVEIVNSGFPAIEGYGDTVNEVKNADGSVRFGYITFPSNNQIAKNALRCSPNSTPSLETTSSNGWSKLQISPYPYDATLIYAGPNTNISGTPVLPFTHYDASGKKLDGVFLGGYDNTTTWGVKYYPKGTGSYGQDFYYVRLLGPQAGSLASDEKTAFIKVVP